MPSEPVAAFLAAAREQHLLPDDVFDGLLAKPGCPQDDVIDLADFLHRQGWLTAHQANLVRAGHADGLGLAGYPITGDAGLCPGGKAFASLHPTLRTPLILRRYRPDWTAPADEPVAFVRRARAACNITHAHLATLVEVGEVNGEPYAAYEPFPGSTLDALVRDIGPMPTALACDYVRQTALALQAAHDRGLCHGNIRPLHVTVGPLTVSSRKKPDGSPLLRPAADSTVKLFELGLVPLRPTTTDWAYADPLAATTLAYLPPERATSPEATVAGDVYGLGVTLFYLLTGRPPFQSSSAAEVVERVATTPLPPLGALRPDLPATLVACVGSLTAKHPVDRPATAGQVAEALEDFAHPPVQLTAAPPELKPVADDELTPPASEWSVTPYDGPVQHDENFAPSALSDKPGAAPKPRRVPPPDTGFFSQLTTKAWLMIAGGLWLVAVPLLWFVLLSQNGCFAKPKVDAPSAPPKPGKKITK